MNGFAVLTARVEPLFLLSSHFSVKGNGAAGCLSRLGSRPLKAKGDTYPFMSLLARVFRIVRAHTETCEPSDAYDHWRPRRRDPPLHGPYYVKRVIDGDTVCLLMNGRPEPVRLIGIDAGRKQSTRTGDLNTSACSRARWLKSFCLVAGLCLSYKKTERRDRYDRILAYMYRVPDGLFINREMIRLGCAKAYSFNGHPYKEDFARVENEARSAELGLWNPRPGNTPPNYH